MTDMDRQQPDPQRLESRPVRWLTRARRHAPLLVLLTIYLAVTLTYSLLYPLGEAPDEVAHLDLIRFIGQEGHLPLNYAQRQAAGNKSDWPMLYHALIGAATRWINYDALPRLKVNDASFRHLLIEDGISPFVVIHTDDEAFPYQGVALLGHLARLVSALLTAGTLVVIYLTVLVIRPGDQRLALSVVAVTASIPQFHFIASAVNDDNLLGLLSALFMLTLFQAWRCPESRWTYARLGLWLGLALTTKYSVALFPILVLLVLAHAVRQGRLKPKAAIGRLLVFGMVMTVAAAWWFVYIEWHFNEVGELGLAAGLLKPLLAGGPDVSMRRVASAITGGAISASDIITLSDTTLWDWSVSFFKSFWLMAGQMTLAVDDIFYAGLLVLSLLSVGGLSYARYRGHALPWGTIGLGVVQVLLLLPFPLLRFYLTGSPEEAGQGRHLLFPAATTVGLLLTLGISAWASPARRHRVGPILALGLLVFSLVSFSSFVLPAFPSRLPVRTSAAATDNLPNPVKESFGNAIELRGYQVGEVNRYGALPVTLVWYSLAYADQDYLVELSLLDEMGATSSLWQGHPLNGRYPTRAWDPGDVVRDTIWLPLMEVKAGDYRVRLRLLASDHTKLPPDAGRELFLDEVAIPALPPLSPVHTHLSGKSWAGFDIWQAGEPVTGIPVYGCRATIPITLYPSISNQTGAPGTEGKPQLSDEMFLVGPDGVEQTPQARAGNTYLFHVGTRWPSGEYRLRVRDSDGTIESQPVLKAQVRPRKFDLPPMGSSVRANFGDELMLLGFDFPQRRAQPGGGLPLTLYWQALRPMTHHYVVSAHLLNSSDLRQWGGHDRVPQNYYSTVLWTPGEVVVDDYPVLVDPSAPPGVYRLDIGVYLPVAQGAALHLPLVADGKALDANSVSVGPIKVGGPPPGVVVATPAPQHPRADNLEGLVTLLGYDVSLEPQAVRVTLYWRCQAVLPIDYTTFVHIRDVSGQPGAILAQMDRPPAEGAYPTSLWEPGEVVRDPVRIPLPEQAPPGKYEVILGLYDLVTGKRLLVLNPQGQAVSDHIRLEQEITLR